MARLDFFPRICVALGFADAEALAQHAHREAEAGETFFEFRLDYLERPEQGVKLIKSFLQRHADCTVLATCRRRASLGRFAGNLEEQFRVLEAAVKAGAGAVDIEVESVEAAPARVEEMRQRARVLLSYHNAEGTPALEPVLRRMMRFPADGYKVVTTARKPSDNYRLVALAKAHPRTPLVILAMGEAGVPSRVLSPAFGGLHTYAAPTDAAGTAAGQLSARQLRRLYGVEKLSRSAKVYGVVAHPVGHSLSPAVHNRAFQSRRLPAVYLPFLVARTQLADFFRLAGQLPLAGFSVTIPHKQRVMRHLDAVDSLARRIGAVNTVWRKAGRWRGANSDVDGVRLPLERRMRLAGASILLAGNGGAARGAAFTLVEAGAKVSVVGRNPERARALARACGAEPLLREQIPGRHFDGLVHATPLGMFPHVDECFFPDRIPAEVVFDMVYNPQETLLLRRAGEQGKTVIPGLEMFLEQAARQFEIWTGQSAPRAAMERAALEALGHTQRI